MQFATPTLHPEPSPDVTHLARGDVQRLLSALTDLSHQHDVAGIAAVVRQAARDLTGADGVTLVLREGPLVHYVEENAVGPLWKGRRFPIDCCVSGWAMLQQEPVVIDDVYQDDRVPHDVYRQTFVKSLAMVPIRPSAPLGAIGAYWATRRRATQREIELLTAFASPTAVALENAALYQQLEEAVRARDVFLAAASHELRTPLASLRLKAQHAMRLHDSGADPARARRALGDLDRHERRLSHLVNTMLEVSQAEREGVRIVTAPVELGALARDVVRRFADRQDGGSVTVRAPSPVVVDCDVSRIDQVIAELVANALRWGEGRGVEVTVTREPGLGCVEVADRGLGIAPEHQERIFERYERNVSVRNFGGLGVGLWLARRFVEAHCGRIDVQSQRGEGSRFTVRLPA